MTEVCRDPRVVKAVEETVASYIATIHALITRQQDLNDILLAWRDYGSHTHCRICRAILVVRDRRHLIAPRECDCRVCPMSYGSHVGCIVESPLDDHPSTYSILKVRIREYHDESDRTALIQAFQCRLASIMNRLRYYNFPPFEMVPF